jgi:hypothetical protein
VDQALEVLDRLDVLPKRRTESGGHAVNIIIGMPGHPAGPDPFDDRDVIDTVATNESLPPAADEPGE